MPEHYIEAPPPLPDHSEVIVFPPVIPLTGFLLGGPVHYRAIARGRTLKLIGFDFV